MNFHCVERPLKVNSLCDVLEAKLELFCPCLQVLDQNMVDLVFAGVKMKCSVK